MNISFRISLNVKWADIWNWEVSTQINEEKRAVQRGRKWVSARVHFEEEPRSNGKERAGLELAKFEKAWEGLWWGSNDMEREENLGMKWRICLPIGSQISPHLLRSDVGDIRR